MKWTQDEAVDFETAREVITNLMAIQSRQIEEERQKDVPDQKRMTELHDYRARLADEQTKLHINEPAKIARILEDYGPVVRSWRAQHSRSVS